MKASGRRDLFIFPDRMSLTSAVGRRSDGDGMDSCKTVQDEEEVVEDPRQSNSTSGVSGLHVHKQVKQKQVKSKPVSTIKRTSYTVPHEPYKAAVNDVQMSVIKSRPTSVGGDHGGNHFFIPFTGALCKGSGNGGSNGSANWLDADRSERIIGVREVPAAEQVWAVERDRLENQLQSLRSDKRELETQLRVQTQVNGELKRLLVASVGEDIETRVHFLTEDKTRLAHSLMNYSQKQTEDTEHVERLTIQCDVWRSKFLATSLMVDELASWKAVLGYRLEEALDTIRILLDEFDKVHHHVRNALGYISPLFDNREKSDRNVTPSNLMKDATTIEEFAESLHCELLNAKPKIQSNSRRTPECRMTTGQRLAHQVLINSLNFDLLPSAGHSCRALAAPPRFHLSTRYEHLTFNCCGHCKGDIKLM